MQLTPRRHRSDKPLIQVERIITTNYLPEDGRCRIEQTQMVPELGQQWRRVSRGLYIDPGEASQALFGRVAWLPWQPVR